MMIASSDAHDARRLRTSFSSRARAAGFASVVLSNANDSSLCIVTVASQRFGLGGGAATGFGAGAGGGAGAAAGGGGVTGVARGTGFGTRSGSHWTVANAGVQ